INDDKLAIAKLRCVIFLREHDCQTLRCRDKEMRTLFTKVGPARLRRVARTQMDRQFLIEAHAGNRGAQVFLDVVSKCSQRRDVNALDSIERIVTIDLAEEKIEDTQESGERFAAPSRRGQQNRLSI